MEMKRAAMTPPTSSLLSSELICIIILEAIISFFNISLKLSKRFFSSIASLKPPKPQHRAEEAARAGEADGVIMRREEVELVIEKMGLMNIGKGEEGGQFQKLGDFLAAEEVEAMFEEKEPSLEEVKEAFAVFDENGDGFVEPLELQRVLRKLGFVEGTELEDCTAMIGAHDENGDGLIDFGEFVKFMESGFCSSANIIN